jgi:ABC-type phosphonate transport system ATPase subunit
VRLRWREGVEAARVGPAAGLEELFLIDADPGRDFLRTWIDFKKRIPADCLCFARNAGGSLYLIGIGERNYGQIFFWARSFEADIDIGELPSYDNIADVADSFNDFLLTLRDEPRSGESLDAWVQRVYRE